MKLIYFTLAILLLRTGSIAQKLDHISYGKYHIGSLSQYIIDYSRPSLETQRLGRKITVNVWYQTPVNSKNKMSFFDYAVLENVVASGSDYAVSGLKVGDAPFLAANVLVCRQKPGTDELLERVMLNATVIQHKLAATKALVSLGKSDVVRKQLADGKLGNISTKERDMLSGRDPFLFTCPMAQPNS